MDIWLNTRERLLRTTDEIHHGQDLSSFNFSFTLIFFFFVWNVLGNNLPSLYFLNFLLICFNYSSCMSHQIYTLGACSNVMFTMQYSVFQSMLASYIAAMKDLCFVAVLCQ